MLSEFSMTYFGSMEVNLKSMLWMDVKMFVAPCTTHSRVSGIAIGVHQERKTGSFREHNGKTPEKWPSTRTTYVKYWFLLENPRIKFLLLGRNGVLINFIDTYLLIPKSHLTSCITRDIHSTQENPFFSGWWDTRIFSR